MCDGQRSPYLNISSNSSRNSLLCRQWKYVLPSTLVSYIVLQSLNGYFKFNGHHVCDYDKYHNRPLWVQKTTLGVFLCFIFGMIFVILRHLKINQTYQPEKFSSVVANLTIQFIAGSSACLTYFFEWGGICKDDFGVVTPGAIWPEWLASGPLLVWFAISCEHKSILSWSDITTIGLMEISIFLGFLLIFRMSFIVKSIILFLSCVCCGFVVLVSVRSKAIIDRAINSILDTRKKALPSDEKLALLTVQKDALEGAVKQKNVGLVCTIGMLIYPVLYFLSIFGIVSEDITYVSFMVTGVFVKFLITTIITEENVESVEDLRFLVARHAYEVQVDALTRNREVSKCNLVPSNDECVLVELFQ